MLLAKKTHFFPYLDLIKMRLEIMLSDFAGKKETFFGIKKRIFKVQKIALFQRVNSCFWSKNAIFFSI